MPRLPSLLICIPALLGQVSDLTVELARKAIRPSVVGVCQRACENLQRSDWKRVHLSLVTAAPLASTLDTRWRTSLAPALERAVDEQNPNAVLQSLLSIVYWDARDLLSPLLLDEEMDPLKVKTRLLKATQNLRYLAPIIWAPRKPKRGEAPQDREQLYADLEKHLVNLVRQIPTDAKYGRNANWRRDVRENTRLFLAAFQGALPEHHGKPPPEKDQPVQQDVVRAEKEKPKPKPTPDGGTQR